MMAERGQRIFRSGRPVRVSDRPDGRIANGCGIKREQPVLPQLQIVERGNLHEKIMRMLPVGNGLSKSRFAQLKKQRVLAPRDGGGFEAQHRSRREHARPERVAAPCP